eukprot:6201145-Pleurochrysis_carterae.AAC.2
MSRDAIERETIYGIQWGDGAARESVATTWRSCCEASTYFCAVLDITEPSHASSRDHLHF